MKDILKKLFFGVNIFIFVLTAVAGLVNLGFEYGSRGRIYPGVKIAGVDFGGQTEADMARFFSHRLSLPKNIGWHYKEATFSATTSDLNPRYDVFLMANRAFSVGRQTNNLYYDFLQKLAAITGQINLPAEVSLDENAVAKFEDEVALKVNIDPIDGQFKFEPVSGPDRKGRVAAFANSQNGLVLNRERFRQQLKSLVFDPPRDETVNFELPVKVIYPKVTTSEVNKLGIRELLGTGVSYFYDSIPGRVANIKIGTEKISGSLVAPGEIFSFDEAIGTVSAIFGFQKAYTIREGKTVLEDGGGVCQVSTTLYRAVLNTGLPVLERVGHSYRVPFYEEGGFKPGMDATVYPPSPDFKFKNDTPSWLLIQSDFDEKNSKLSFDIFGESDGRKTEIIGPVILSVTKPPDPIYEDRPDQPTGFLQQVDTAHWGAKTTFTRKVTRNNEVLIDEKNFSDYIPWPARFLRGTKT